MISTLYDLFNYSIANILSTYVKTEVKNIFVEIINKDFLNFTNSKIYLSSFTGDFQGTVLMSIDNITANTISSVFLRSLNYNDKKVDIFMEILNIIVSHFSNALTYEDKTILHTPPIVISGKEIKLKVLKNSHLFRFSLKEGNIDFLIGIKE
jgi:CheY-specific phosphatase CheX